ncbi:MAG: Fe-S cluster assembly scaffold SufA [Sodalis sp. (in: enterobacteria)]
MHVNKKNETESIEKKTWRGLTLTNSAIRQIHYLVKNDPLMLGLRIKVRKSGCAGFTYVLEKVKQTENSDQVYLFDGIKLHVPLKSMPFIDGTELDYIQEGLNHIFKFNNPKAQHACGCGESFGL